MDPRLCVAVGRHGRRLPHAGAGLGAGRADRGCGLGGGAARARAGGTGLEILELRLPHCRRGVAALALELRCRGVAWHRLSCGAPPPRLSPPLPPSGVPRAQWPWPAVPRWRRGCRGRRLGSRGALAGPGRRAPLPAPLWPPRRAGRARAWPSRTAASGSCLASGRALAQRVALKGKRARAASLAAVLRGGPKGHRGGAAPLPPELAVACHGPPRPVPLGGGVGERAGGGVETGSEVDL
mmetsp:Transcript_63592/g.169851  ORF Transcript_63592/g.169851 Transcript_63592/m.169851 type:complete len:239 (-) Transcript_63592:206-922(-)